MSAPPDNSGCRISIGTSGYSYTEWVEAGIYPEGTKSAQMLKLYAGMFPISELNFTWYQMPKAQAVARMQAQVPPDFLFAAKLTRTLTHEIDKDQWRSQAAQYRSSIAPLMQSRQLTAVLLQMAPYFERSVSNRQYLAALLDELGELPLAIEFRHPTWVDDRVFGELARRKVTLVTVDAPSLPTLFPRLEVVTNPDLFYVRFHGRNIQGWRSGSMRNKFDYSYSDGELEESHAGITRIAEKAKHGIIFFNNHVRGQAVENALRLMAMG